MGLLPKFSNYEEEGKCDYGYEALQDFFLSWTIRCSPSTYKTADSKVNEYARRIVYALIFGHNKNDQYNTNGLVPDSFEVKKVSTKRQYGKIDLIAEIIVIEDQRENKYVLNIENKWYSKLKSGQLKDYKDFINKNYVGWKKINLFISCDHCRNNYQQEKSECLLYDYKYLTIEDLRVLSNMENDGRTGNALFDEYWYYQ